MTTTTISEGYFLKVLWGGIEMVLLYLLDVWLCRQAVVMMSDNDEWRRGTGQVKGTPLIKGPSSSWWGGLCVAVSVVGPWRLVMAHPPATHLTHGGHETTHGASVAGV